MGSYCDDHRLGCGNWFGSHTHVPRSPTTVMADTTVCDPPPPRPPLTHNTDSLKQQTRHVPRSRRCFPLPPGRTTRAFSRLKGKHHRQLENQTISFSFPSWAARVPCQTAVQGGPQAKGGPPSPRLYSDICREGVPHP